MSATTTRYAIAQALDRLMESKPLSGITVADVCREAAIARSTFYRYFHDVPNIVSWLWDQANAKGIYQEGRTLSCYDAHLRTFIELRRRSTFFGHAFQTVDYSSLVQYGGNVMERYLVDVFAAKAGRPFNAHEALTVEFFAAGAKHMTRHWALRSMANEPEEMAAAFAESMPAFMLPYLEPDPTCHVEPRYEL